MRRIPQMNGAYNDPALVSIKRTDLRLLLAVARQAELNGREHAHRFDLAVALENLNAKPRKRK